MNKDNVDITQMSMIKTKDGDTVVGLTLTIYNDDGTIKANNYKLSIKVSKDDLILKTITGFSEIILTRILDKINK